MLALWGSLVSLSCVQGRHSEASHRETWEEVWNYIFSVQRECTLRGLHIWGITSLPSGVECTLCRLVCLLDTNNMQHVLVCFVRVFCFISWFMIVLENVHYYLPWQQLFCLHIVSISLFYLSLFLFFSLYISLPILFSLLLFSLPFSSLSLSFSLSLCQ